MFLTALPSPLPRNSVHYFVLFYLLTVRNVKVCLFLWGGLSWVLVLTKKNPQVCKHFDLIEVFLETLCLEKKFFGEKHLCICIYIYEQYISVFLCLGFTKI